MTAKNNDRYGAAIHEAGHAVVAWALGSKVKRMAIGVGGDDSAGVADIEVSSDLPIIDRIAICAAGIDAQRMFDAPTNEISAIMDMNDIRKLVWDYPDAEGEALRYDGYRRSKKLLKKHEKKVVRLAKALAEHTELDQAMIEKMLPQNDPV